MSTITIVQDRAADHIAFRLLPANTAVANLYDDENEIMFLDEQPHPTMEALALLDIDTSDVITNAGRARGIFAAAGYDVEFARWVDAKPDWSNKLAQTFDLIDTKTKINCAIDRIDHVANESVFAFNASSVFGAGSEAVETVRADKARELRAIAQSLLAYADELEGPIIDESESPDIGADADHSIFR